MFLNKLMELYVDVQRNMWTRSELQEESNYHLQNHFSPHLEDNCVFNESFVLPYSFCEQSKLCSFFLLSY